MRLLLISFVITQGWWSTLGQAQVLKPAPLEASSPREDLRKKIFAKNLDQRTCEILATDPAATVSADEALQRTVRSIMKAIDGSDEKILRDHFNPRLKIKAGQVQASLLDLKRITGAKYSSTNYRVVALNSPDGATAPIECQDTGVMIHPLYGYPLAVGVWLQVTGESEVARLFFELVPTAKDWTIGAWHIQQWTHGGKDFAMWYELAQSEAAKGHKAGAFIAADLASKLLDGGGFLVFPVKQDADTWRDKLMSRDAWIAVIKSSFPEDNVIHAATLFIRDGAGVLVRFGITAEMSANAIKAHCKDRIKKIASLEWAQVLQGIRCDYNFPSENPKKEGVLGGLVITKDEALKADAKK